MEINERVLQLTIDHLDLTSKTQRDALETLEGIKQMTGLVMGIERPPMQTRKDLMEYVELCIEAQRRLLVAAQDNREQLILLLATAITPELGDKLNNLLKDT